MSKTSRHHLRPIDFQRVRKGMPLNPDGTPVHTTGRREVRWQLQQLAVWLRGDDIRKAKRGLTRDEIRGYFQRVRCERPTA